VSIGGLVGAAFVKSPAEVAADTAPPNRTVITAKVSSQVLTSTVVLRGVVYPGVQYNITPSAASASVTALYVSKMNVAVGSAVSSGELLAEVSGQPLFALKGAVPAYRDLMPGDSGTDILQLQTALRSLGYSTGSDSSGYFGSGTKAAVVAFYRHLGYIAPTAGAAADAAVAADQKAVTADREAVSSAQAQQPQTSATRAEVSTDQTQLSADETALSQAEAVDGAMVPQGEVVFLPSFPATVTAVNGTVGQGVSGTLLSLTTGELALTGELPPADAGLVKPGMKVQVLDETTNLTANGTVQSLGAATTNTPTGIVVAIGASAGSGSGGSAPAAPGNNNDIGGATSFIPMPVTLDGALSAAWSGENVRVTVDTGSSAGAVLTVPVAAIFTTASGQTEVTTVSASGAQTNVPVSTGVTANGYTQVTALDGGTLKAGDNVAVGQ
jgi:HlyD family secretion protein